MVVTQKREEKHLVLTLEGRLDTTTAPQLEEVLKSSLGGVTHLTLDLAKLVYVSSVGLRVILGAQKQMSKLDGMVVKNVNETVMDVFEVTGFKEILTLE